MGKTVKRIITAIVVLFVAFFVVSFIADYVILGKTFEKRDRVIQPGGSMPTFADYSESHARTPVEFSMDGATLRGYVYESNAAGEPKGFVIFRHGIFANHGYYLPEIIALTDCGWKVFAYDALGAGESDGDSYIGMVQSALDVTKAVEFVVREGLAGDLPIVLWGHSWGGYGVAAALARVPWVSACVTMSGYDDPVGILEETTEGMMGGFAVTQIPTLWLNTKLTFGSSSGMTAVDGINGTSAPVLVIHGTQDDTVHYDGAGIIAQIGRITNPKVEYLPRTEQGRNGHNSYFYSVEANEYGAQKRAELDALTERYSGDIPDDVLESFYADYDVLRANTADPELISIIDDFLTRAVGGSAMKQVQGFTSAGDDSDFGNAKYGAFESAYYSHSGNSMGNLYSLETVRADDGSMIVVEREAEMHSIPITVREYKAPDDIIEQIDAIIEASGMKDWGEIPPSEFIPLDAATPRLSLTFKGVGERASWHESLSLIGWDEHPDGGQAFDQIRDLLTACVKDGNLIREYSEEVRH